MGIYNSWEAPGLQHQLHAFSKLRLQLRALKKLQLQLKLRDLSDDDGTMSGIFIGCIN